MKKPIQFGKYYLLDRINVGGMAEVFKAKAFGVEGFERLLAVKRILPNIAEDEEFITMFIDEARISVQLNHANVVHIHELGKHDDAYFIAMEYVSGRDLRTILERYRRRKEIMPTAQAVYVCSKIWAMLAWLSWTESLASSMNMRMNSLSSAMLGRMRLTATRRSKPSTPNALARNTSAIPPMLIRSRR